MRTVFMLDLESASGVPSELEEVLRAKRWKPVRPGLAYSLDWSEAVNEPEEGTWPRIEAVLNKARGLGVDHVFLTVGRGEKIPIPQR